MLGVNITVGDDFENAKGLVEYLDINFPVLMDYDGSVTELYGIKSIPNNIIVGSDGIVTENFLGEIPEEEIWDDASLQADALSALGNLGYGHGDAADDGWRGFQPVPQGRS